MKAGTKVKYYLITDSRITVNNTSIVAKQPGEIRHEIENLFNDLLNNTEGLMYVENLHAIAPRFINWQDGFPQCRMDFTLITKVPMTQGQIYTFTNKIQAHPLKFKQP